ncbi:MAG: tetratricopeptide repeat protein [Gammaproteobacteria bacterium]
MVRSIVLFICVMLPIASFAYKDDYVWQEKFKQQLPLAESGNAEAQYDLGTMYERGNGVAKDMQKAFDWYLKAAKQGSDKGAYKVGLSYLHGKGVKEDHKKALKWLNDAADKNYVRAFYFIGTMYEKGDGVSKDLNKALRWYTRAYKGGYTIAKERANEVRETVKEREIQAELQRQRRLARRRAQMAKSPPIKPAKTNVKKLLLSGGWSKSDKPAEYLPSKLTDCKDKGKTIECVSNEVTRNIGMADIRYRTKAILYSLDDKGEFKVSYRNNVVDIKVTDPDFTANGGKVPVKMGWQDAEHKLVCAVENNKELKCTKNKLRDLTFNRN